MNNLPWFVFPVSLDFYLSARHTYKQLITLYNPYDFAVNFKVLCTSPHKFSVIDPEGVIAPQSCIDIIIRYNATTQTQIDTADKFRINMTHRKTHQALGKRDIPVRFLEGEPTNLSSESVDDNFQPLSVKQTNQKTQETSKQTIQTQRSGLYREPQQVNIIAVIVSICCITALLLPTQEEKFPDSQLPHWLHITVNLKLVFSFVLGLVSMLVLRP